MERQIFLDTETTGLDPSKGHRIVEIGCLEMKNRRLTGRTFHTYLNPDREMDKGATEISGITTEFLQDKPKFEAVVEGFIDFVAGAELIIHNAPFDLSFLNSELLMLKHIWKCQPPNVQVFDTLALARQMHPGQRNNLDALCRRYNIDNSHRTYHGALLDAEILSKVYLVMTAGQTQFAMGADSIEQTTIASSKRRKIKIKRNDFPLTIIKASEEELQRHLWRLEKLKKIGG